MRYIGHLNPLDSYKQAIHPHIVVLLRWQLRRVPFSVVVVVWILFIRDAFNQLR